jgi:hypothetical protein
MSAKRTRIQLEHFLVAGPFEQAATQLPLFQSESRACAGAKLPTLQDLLVGSGPRAPRIPDPPDQR